MSANPRSFLERCGEAFSEWLCGVLRRVPYLDIYWDGAQRTFVLRLSVPPAEALPVPKSAPRRVEMRRVETPSPLVARPKVKATHLRTVAPDLQRSPGRPLSSSEETRAAPEDTRDLRPATESTVDEGRAAGIAAVRAAWGRP